MHVILKTVGDTGATRRVVIRASQVVRVGSTEWADLCVTDDPQLADEHFSVECTGVGCRVRSLGASPTLVEGQPVELQDVGDGQLIQAGGTKFRVEFHNAPVGRPAGAEESGATEPGAPAAPAAPLWPHLRVDKIEELADVAAFDDVAMHAMTEAGGADEFVRILQENEQAPDLIKFFAHGLPKRRAVWFGAECIEPHLPEGPQREAVGAARKWCLEQDEPSRLGCETAAQQCEGPASLLALAAFWSGGSMVSVMDIDVAPDPAMTGNMVAACLAASLDMADDMMSAIVDTGVRLATEDMPWDDEQAA